MVDAGVIALHVGAEDERVVGEMLVHEPDGGLRPAPPLQVVAVVREVWQPMGGENEGGRFQHQGIQGRPDLDGFVTVVEAANRTESIAACSQLWSDGATCSWCSSRAMATPGTFPGRICYFIADESRAEISGPTIRAGSDWTGTMGPRNSRTSARLFAVTQPPGASSAIYRERRASDSSSAASAGASRPASNDRPKSFRPVASRPRRSRCRRDFLDASRQERGRPRRRVRHG